MNPSTTEEGLPILKKKGSIDQTEDGLPILKKKEVSDDSFRDAIPETGLGAPLKNPGQESISAAPSPGTTPYEMTSTDAPASGTTSGAGEASVAKSVEDIIAENAERRIQGQQPKEITMANRSVSAIGKVGEYIAKHAEQIGEGIKTIGTAGEELNGLPDKDLFKEPLKSPVEKSISGTLDLIKGGAETAFGAISFTPIGAAFNEGMELVPESVNKWLQAPLTKPAELAGYKPEQGSIGEKFLSTGDIVGQLLLMHKAGEGIKSATTIDGITSEDINKAGVELKNEELADLQQKLKNQEPINMKEAQTVKQVIDNATPEDLDQALKLKQQEKEEAAKPSVTPTFQKSQQPEPVATGNDEKVVAKPTEEVSTTEESVPLTIEKESSPEEKQSASILVAPFYDTVVKDAAHAEELRQSPAYKTHVENMHRIAKQLGIEVESIEPHIGGFKNGEGNKINEISDRVNLKVKDLDQAEQYAALMGVHAPEVQESTIASQYVKYGDDGHNGSEYKIHIDNPDEAVKALKEAGIDNYSINEEDGTVSILQLNEFPEKDLIRRISIFEDKIGNNGKQSRNTGREAPKSPKRTPIRSKYVDARRRAEIYRELRDRREQGGSDLRASVEEAIRKNDRFLGEKKLDKTRSEYNKLRDREKSGEELTAKEAAEMRKHAEELTPSIKDSVEASEDAYKKAKKEIDATAKEVVWGAGYVSPVKLKTPERATTKILKWYEGKPNKLGDGARVNIVIEDISKAPEIFAVIKEKYKGGVIRETTEKTSLGFEKNLLEVRTSNGRISEFQVITPRELIAKEGIAKIPEDQQAAAIAELAKVSKAAGQSIPDGVGHWLYEVNRDDSVPKDIRDEAAKISRDYYEAFTDPEKFKASGVDINKELSGFASKIKTADKKGWDIDHSKKIPKTIEKPKAIPTQEEVRKTLEAKKSEIAKVIEKPIVKNPETVSKDIIKAKVLPIKEVVQAVFKPLAKIQDKIFGRNVAKAEDWVAKQIKKGITSQNTIKRKTAQFLTNWANGLPRTEAELADKRFLKGNIQLANEMFSQNIDRLRALVDNNVESIAKVHQVLDADFYRDAGKTPVTFEELNPAEQQLYTILRQMNDYVHDYNYSMGFIDSVTYDKFNGKYIARLYEPFEIPDDVKKFIDEGNHSLNKVYKINTDIFKAREEVDEFKKQNILKDAIFTTAKRMMQTEVNASIRAYTEAIIKRGDVSEGEKPGYTQLNGKGYGNLNGKYVPNFIAEDFKGYFFANNVMDTIYDAFKMYDRNELRQFFKKYYTVWSPTVQLGNMSSNYVFSFLSGIDPVTYSSNLLKAHSILKEKGDVYKLLIKNGILKSDVLTKDIIPLTEKTKSILEKTESVGKSILDRAVKIDKAASDLYGRSDDLAKTSAFLSLKEYGFSDTEAIQKTYDGFQNYASVGKIWDVASKTPIIGNPFTKFQADLQRIVKNAVLKRPLSTAMFLGLLKLTAVGASKWANESEEEKELREGRKFIPKIPIPKMIGGDVPLVFQTPYGEINLARYLSPYYIYDRGDQGSTIENASKFLPYQIGQTEGPGKGSVQTLPLFSDPLLGTYASVLADKDFRGMSIQDPQATRYKSTGILPSERIANSMNYIARAQVPYYSNVADMYSAWKYGTDFYGRDRGPIQSIVNNIVKVQQFGDEKYKEIIENNLRSIEFNITSYESTMKDIDATSQKETEKASTMLEGKRITQEQFDRKIELIAKSAEERQARTLSLIEEQQKKLDDLVIKYDKILNPSVKDMTK